MDSWWHRSGAAGTETGTLIQPLTDTEEPIMSTWRERVDEVVKELQQERDELRVKAALGKAELKDELAELDTKLDAVKSKAAEWADKADDQIDDILDDAKEKTSGWMKEIREGYQKLRDRLDREERPEA